jgi:hypothetical protein
MASRTITPQKAKVSIVKQPRHASSFSRHELPELCEEFVRPEIKRARGMPGAQCTRSLVCAGGSKYAHQYSQRRHRIHPAFPTQWFSRLIRDLPGDEFLFATVASRIVGRARPVGPLSPPQGLASATDARTTRLRRTLQRRSSCALEGSLTRFARPAISSRPTLPASTASRAPRS